MEDNSKTPAIIDVQKRDIETDKDIGAKLSQCQVLQTFPKPTVT